MIPGPGVGSGLDVIDATVENEFSAYVKGDSPVIAYRIGIFKNNATSDLVYNSGVIELEEPFYGVDTKGRQVPFKYTVPANTGIDNGYIYGYKYILTLWWQLDESDYTTGCAESFEVVFFARSSPTLSIDQISDNTSEETGLPVLNVKSNVFSATYYQGNNIGISWFKWTLCNIGDYDNPIEVLGPVYQNPRVQFEYDGLNTDSSYSIMVELQTQDGILLKTDWVDFSVKYETVQIQSAVEIRATDNNGVMLDFSGLKYIEGVPNGVDWRFIYPCPFEGHVCVELDEGTNITFQGTEHFGIDIPLDGEGVISFFIDDNTDEIIYVSGTDDNGDPFYMRLRYEGHIPGLMPNESLSPSESLVPSTGQKGYMILDVNGVDHRYTIKGRISNTWFVVRFSAAGAAIYEMTFPFPELRENMEVLEGYLYGH